MFSQRLATDPNKRPFTTEVALHFRKLALTACLSTGAFLPPSTLCSQDIAIENVNNDEALISQLPDGFVAIFDGRSLDGWHGRPQMNPADYEADFPSQSSKWKDITLEHWHVADEALVNDGDGPYLTTDRQFEDFELLLQYKTVAGADSGIYLRGVPQVQIWDWTDPKSIKLGADKGSGGLWNNAPDAKGKDPMVLADRNFGEWNQFRIRLIGERCWVWLNGKAVVDDAPLANYFDRKVPLNARGPIQLQTHGGEIQWRSIFINELDAAEANAILREADMGQANLYHLFDGTNLPGWAGATGNYEAVLRCKEGQGGTLYSEKEFDDFDLYTEFRLPAAGNNGLVIRYPIDSNGSADGAYKAMCELQVLDDSDPSYASLDPRQSHGSAYGMVAATRGYLRPVGTWNYQKVSVRGSKIVVELNGTKILDADLAGVDSFLDDKPHPGKDRVKGAIGLAGHNDPVEFRLIAVSSNSQ